MSSIGSCSNNTHNKRTDTKNNHTHRQSYMSTHKHHTHTQPHNHPQTQARTTLRTQAKRNITHRRIIMNKKKTRWWLNKVASSLLLASCIIICTRPTYCTIEAQITWVHRVQTAEKRFCRDRHNPQGLLKLTTPLLPARTATMVIQPPLTRYYTCRPSWTSHAPPAAMRHVVSCSVNPGTLNAGSEHYV